MTVSILTGRVVINPQNPIKADEHSRFDGRSANDKSPIKELTFGDTGAWHQKSKLSHAFSQVVNRLFGASKNKPLPIRTRAPSISRYIWRKVNVANGINKPVPACGPQKLYYKGVSGREEVYDLKFRTIPNGEIKNKDGDKFDWVFSPKVELNFTARTKYKKNLKPQKLLGFAYSVRKQTNMAEKNHSGRLPSFEDQSPSDSKPFPIPDFTQNDRPVVVYFGGHGLPVEWMSPGQGYACAGKDYVDAKQVNFLALNYRGYGGSSCGVPSHRSMVEDGLAIVNHLLETGIDAKRIILHGYSMGGNIAANVTEAAEAKGHTLGGLILDRPMETLCTGAAALTQTKSRNFARNYILSPIVRVVVRLLCEAYNTSKTLKSLLQKRDLAQKEQENQEAPKKAWTPVVGVYDNDPIGLTSKRMFETRDVEYTGINGGHNVGLRKILRALDGLYGASSEAEPKPAINRLYENFLVKPADDPEKQQRHSLRSRRPTRL